MKEHLTSSWISPSSAKCPLATFSIPHHWTVHLLIVSMLPVVGAIPSSNGISANNIFRKDVSTSTSAPSSTTLSASSTSNPGSHASSNTQLVLLISVFCSIVVTVVIILFLWKWWQRRRGRSFSKIREKDEDREPLSASFQRGELPELLYLPERVAARTPRLA